MRLSLPLRGGMVGYEAGGFRRISSVSQGNLHFCLFHTWSQLCGVDIHQYCIKISDESSK